MPSDDRQLSGDLQLQLMSAVWRLGSATVEQARSALPPRYRGAYTTVQTVLNRLTMRDLLTRTKVGNAFEYRPRISEGDYLAQSIEPEGDYLAQSIEGTLAGASSEARQVAIARLIGGLDTEELAELQRLAGEDGRRRRRR